MDLFRIVPMTEEHIDEASQLFVNNYNKLREKVPYMPERHSDKNNIVPMIRGLLEKNPGAAAVQGNKLVGYLIGILIPEFKGRDNGVVCTEWGHGTTDENRREIYRKMYEYISSIWVEKKHLNHAIIMLAHDKEAIDTWFWNGFGMLTVDVVRTMRPVECPELGSVKVRRANHDDINSLLPIMQEHRRYYPKAPLFLVIEDMIDTAEIEELLDEPGVIIWIAEEEGQIVGFMQTRDCSDDASFVVRDSKTASIWGAYVKNDTRSKGIGSLILKAVIDWARENGFERCSLDFESANIYGSKFWLRHFEPVCYSALRHVDDRIIP